MSTDGSDDRAPARRRIHVGPVLAASVVLLLAPLARAQVAPPALVGQGRILIAGLSVDVDTRPDLPDGPHYLLTVVKDFPSGVATVLPLPPERLQGFLVEGRLVGPGLGSQSLTLRAPAGGRFEIPALGAAGDYFFDDVHLLDPSGARVVNRSPTLPRVTIHAIDQLLVSEVTTRQLTLDEIRSKGIVVDPSSFSVFNFSLTLELDSKAVSIQVPVVQPLIPGVKVPEIPKLPDPTVRFSGGVGAVPDLRIPNFHVGGFFLEAIGLPEGDELKELPGIPGLIIIPGDVGFLHEFFSALLIVHNVGPAGSGLTVSALKAKINLPPGPDGILGTGDDPLRLARTAQGGIQDTLPIRRVVPGASGAGTPSSDDFLMPQEKGQAEFLIEGLLPGLATFGIDITGKLYVPSRSQSYDLKGKAAGAVLVRNPTFNITLAHPETVREGERYSLFATVMNTSKVDANLFRLRLAERSLVGTRLVPGTPSSFSLDVLRAGASETFELRLESRITGRVRSGFLQSDDGLTGSFILTTGVGENGIDLSSDTLLLPDFLVGTIPDPPPLKLDFMRMLGLAWSLATVPQSGLPQGLSRPGRGSVVDRARAFAAMGFRIRLGETVPRAVSDWGFDYLETEIGRLDAELSPTSSALADARAQAQNDLLALDALRRRARQGRFVLRDIGAILENEVGAGRLADVVAAQALLARASSGRAPYLCAAIGRGASGVPARLLITADDGRRLGATGTADPLDPDGSDGRVNEIGMGGVIPLLDAPGSHMEMALLATTSGTAYTVDILGEGTGSMDLGLVMGLPGGLERVTFTAIPLARGSRARIRVVAGAALPSTVSIDLRGTGAFDTRSVAAAPPFEPEPPPGVIAVRQWGKGNAGVMNITFEKGDPFGRLLVVLFDKRVDRTTAENVSSYAVAGNQVVSVALQADRRVAFIMLRIPLSPLPPQKWLSIGGVTDLDGNAIAPVTLPILPDPDGGYGGSLAGIVRRATGEPVAGATIVEQVAVPTLDGIAYVPILSTLTASDGGYAIDWVLANELGAAEIDAYDLSAGEQATINVQPYFMGQKLRGDFIIRGFGSVSGRVMDAQGLPVGCVYDANGNRTRTVAVGVTGRNGTAGAYVNPDGTFLVTRVPVGAVIVTAGDSLTSAVGVAETRVRSSEDVAKVSIVLFSSHGSVTGRVLRADGITPGVGLPVVVGANAPVAVGPEGLVTQFTDVGLATTDATGGFSIQNIPAGPFTVRTFDPQTYEQASAAGFVANAATATATLVLPGAGATIRGVVTNDLGAPEPVATVAGGPGQTVTAVDGTFTLTSFPLGKYKIGAQARGRPAFGDVSVDLLSPGDIQTVVIRLRPLGSIAGVVHAADGQTPIGGEPVILWTGGGVLYRARSNSLGQFRFDNVPAYDLSDPTKPGAFKVQSVNYNAHQGGAPYDGGEAVTTLGFGGQTAVVDVIYRGRGPVRGRLVLQNGNPALGDVLLTVTEIVIVTEDTGQGGVAGEVQADERALATSLIQGYGSVLAEYGVALPQEAASLLSSQDQSVQKIFPYFTKTQIKLKGTGLGPQGWVDGRFSVDSVLGGPLGVAASAPFTGTVTRSGEMPRTFDQTQRFFDFGDLVLTPTVGNIAGRVFMPDGVTPVGAGVRVTYSTSPPVYVFTAQDGTYQFLGLPVGGFNLTADTGAPQLGTGATTSAQIVTNAFQDGSGNRLLNVRLFGSARGTLPPNVSVTANVRLEGAGGVRVTVLNADGTPAAGALATVVPSSPLDGPVAQGFVDQAADSNGVVEFVPVAEGGFQVSARTVGGPLPGFAAGAIPRTPQDGLRRDVTVTLGRNVAPDGTTTTIQGIGTVMGKITEPTGETFTGIASVAVSARGATLLTTVTGNGQYLVYPVPIGAVQVSVVDVDRNRSASASGTLLSNGGTVEVDVQLSIEGSVSGRVTSFDGASVVTGAAVRLDSSSGGSFVTQADLAGRYSLAGIPIGAFQVTAEEPITGIRGIARGAVVPPVEAQEVNIRLSAVGSVLGKVYAGGTLLDAQGRPVDAQGNPVSGTVVPFVQLTLSNRGFSRSAVSLADGSFAFPALAADTYTLSARHQTLPDGATRQVTLTDNGSTVDGSLALAGTGRVRGRVRDSVTGAGVPSVSLVLSSKSAYASGVATRLTAPDGTFSFDPVPSGAFALSAVTTIGNPPLGTSASGVVTASADVVFDDGFFGALRLEPVGSIAGRVLDGSSPSTRAIVTVRSARVEVAQRCAGDGTFRLDGLPVGAYALEAADPSGARVRAQVTVIASAVAQTGDLVLDRTRPAVIATSPIDGNWAVPLDAPVTVTFSETIDPATINPSTFLVRIAGRAVAGQVLLRADGRTAVFTAAQLLPSLTLVRVDLLADVLNFDGTVATPGIENPNGFSMTAPVTLTFLTTDRTPPAVVSLSPADGSSDVALDSVVRIAFSKPMNPGSLAGMQLLENGAPVAGAVNSTPILANTVFVFTPARILDPNARFVLSIPGPIMDTWGNVLPGGSFGAQLRSLDTLGAVLTGLRLGGPAIRGQPLALSVTAQDQASLVSVDYFVQGVLAGTASQAPFGLVARVDPALPASVTIAAVGTDAQGIRGVPFIVSAAVADDAPPTIAIRALAQTTVRPGDTLRFTADAQDDVGISSVRLVVQGILGAAQTTVLSVPVPVTSASLSVVVPATLASGTVLTLRASASDTGGLVQEANPTALIVTNTAGPVVTIVSPAQSSAFGAAASVSVVVQAVHADGVASLAFEVDQGTRVLVARTTTATAGAPTIAQGTFAFTTPAPFVMSLVVRAFATDVHGTTSEAASLSMAAAGMPAPPTVAVSLPQGAQSEPGKPAGADVAVVAANNLTEVDFLVNGALVEARAPGAVTRTTQRFALTVPTGTALGTTYRFGGQATDVAGNRSPLVEQTLTVADLTPPAIGAPSITGGFTAGTVVTVVAAASDNIALAAISVVIDGAFTAGATFLVVPPTVNAQAAWSFTIPAAAAPGAAFTVRVRAQDTSGNTSPDAVAVLSVAGSGIVSGTVTSPSGSPVPGASVTLTAANGVFVTTTASTGQYAVSGVGLGGTVQASALDPATGFRGQASGSFPAQSSALTLNVALIGTGTVNVTVTGASGTAIQGASVTVTSSTGSSRTLATDATGLASFAATPSGSFSVAVSDPASGLTGSASGTLATGALVSVGIRLVPLGTLSGVVYAPDGATPVNGAVVALAGAITGSFTTGASGAFQFASVPTGPYALSALDGAGLLRARVLGIAVSQGLVTTQSLTFTGLGTVTGTARDPNGPVAGLTVSLQSASALSRGPVTTSTDAQGRYRIGSVPAGAFTVSAQETSPPFAGSASGQVSRDGDLVQADLQLAFNATTGTVSGSVTSPGGAAVAGASVTLTAANGVFVTTTASSGQYAVPGVGLGGTVQASALDPATGLRGRASGSFPAPSSALTLNVALDATGTVKGTLTRSDGTTPAGNVSVSINRTLTTGQPSTMTTTAQGGFEFDYVPLGAFTLAAADAATGDRGQASNQVSAAGDVRTINFSLLGVGTVRVTVTNASGTAVQGAQASVASQTSFGGTTTVQTDATGLATFPRTLAGSFSVYVTDPSSGLQGTGSGMLAAGTTVTVAVQLQALGSVAGLVYAPNGATTVSGAAVALGYPAYRSSATDSSGAFRFDGVPLYSSYALSASDGNGILRAREFNVPLLTSGAVATRNLTFIGLGTVTGTARDSNGPVAGIAVSLQSANQTIGRYRSTTTDSLGHYQVANVPVGGFTVSAQDPTRQLGGSSAGQISRDGDLVLADILLANNAQSLPFTTTDANGCPYDAQRNGSSQYGYASVFAGNGYAGSFLLDLVVNGTANRFSGASYGSKELSGRGLSIRQQSVAGLDVTRKVFVPRDGYFARRLELLTNSSASPVTLTVRLTDNVLGNSYLGYCPQQLVATSSGGSGTLSTAASNPDRWAVTHDQAASVDTFLQGTQPPVAFVYDGPGGADRVAAASYTQNGTDGQIVLEWQNVTIPPGATVAYLHFASQQVSRAAAIASATRLDALPPEALFGLAPAEIAAIRNFAVPAGGLSALAPFASLTGTIEGRALAGDGGTPIPGAFVTFKSANIYYSRTWQKAAGTAPNNGTDGFYLFHGIFNDQGSSLPVPVDSPFTITVTHPQTQATAQVTGAFTGTYTGNLSLSAAGAASSSLGGGSAPQSAMDNSANTSWLTNYGDSAQSGTAPFLDATLVGPATVTSLNILGTRVSSTYAVLRGRVDLLDISGSVLATATLDFSAPSYDRAYTFPSAVTGVARARFTTLVDQYQSSGLAELQVLGSVPSSAGAAHVDVIMTGTGELAGTVTRHTGALVTSGTVTFPLNGGSVNGQVSASGTYLVSGVPPGTYALTASTYPSGAGPLVGTATAVVLAGPTTTANITIQPTGALSVTVTTASGAPAQSVLVRVTNSSNFGATLWTNASGVAFFPDVPVATVGVQVTDPVTGIVSSAQAAVVQDQTAQQTITLVGHGTVSATIQSASGVPVANRQVYVQDARQSYPYNAGWTDAAGRLTIVNVAAGAFTVTVNDPTTGNLAGSATGTMTNGANLPVTVQTLAVATVQVHVVGQAAGTTVYLSDTTALGWTYYLSGNTDASGNVTFASVPEGRFAVNTYNPFASNAATITHQQDGQTISITLPASTVGPVDGTIFAADGQTPLPTAYVEVIDAATTQSLYAVYANNSGYYRVGSVATGALGFIVRGHSPYNYNVTRDGAGAIAATGVTVTVNLVLPVPVMNGTVFYSDGTPVPSPTVRFSGPGGVSYATSTPSGTYGIPGVSAGTGTLFASDPASGLSTTLSATVSSTATIVTVNVTLPVSGIVTGTVRDNNGNPVPGASVLIRSSGLNFQLSLTANAQGVYTAGHVALGQISVLGSNAAGVSSYASGALGSAGATTQVDIALPASGAVSGTLFASGGGPFQGGFGPPSVSIRSLVPRGPFGFASVYPAASSSGTFSAPSVTAGPIQVIATYFVYQPGIADAIVAAGGTTTVNVTMGSAVALTDNLDGADGFRYDVSGDGHLYNGGTTSFPPQYAYAGAYSLKVGGTAFNYLSAGEPAGTRQVSIGPDGPAGLVVTRRVYSPAAGGFARFLEVLSNPGSTPIATDVLLRSNSAAGNATRILVGPTQTANAYAVLDDGLNGGTPAIPALADVFGGAGSAAGSVGPSTMTFTSGSSLFSVDWPVTVPAGGTVIIMHFAVQASPGATAAATTQAAALANLTDPNATTNMSAAEKAAVVNFTVR